MTPRPMLALLLAVLIGVPGLAHACTLTANDGGPQYANIQSLPPGTFTGHIQCGATRHHLSVWTMLIDRTAQRVGVRDDPLFQVRAANPLTPIARVGYDRDIRFTIFRRTTESLRDIVVRQLFATVCAGAGDPLDCSLGERRVKIRIELRDTTGDGAFDRAYHQMSIYDGGSRLQVIYVDLPADAELHRLVGAWIAFFNDTGVVDLRGT